MVETIREEQIFGRLKSWLHVDPSHIPGLDGLRSVAALMVLAVHMAFFTGTLQNPTWGELVGDFSSGVAIFFVLSGFLLYRPFVRAHLARSKSPSVPDYFIRRFLRIMPAYWVCLLVSAWVFHAVEFDGLKRFLAHFLLLRIYSGEFYNDGLGQMWSLGTELSFYFVLPLLALLVGWLVRRFDRVNPLVFEFGLVGVLFAIPLVVWGSWSGDNVDHRVAAQWLPAMFDWFAWGILLAIVGASVELAAIWATKVAKAFRYCVSWWTLGGCCLYYTSEVVFIPRGLWKVSGRGSYGFNGELMTQHLLFGVMAACLVAPFVLCPDGGGALRKVLASTPAAVLGVISYGIFLWHLPLMGELVFEYQLLNHIKGTLFWGGFAVVLAVTCVVATISWLFVEYPLLAGPGGAKPTKTDT